jgi:hypothetical protein
MAAGVIYDDSIISPQDDNPQFLDFFEMIANDAKQNDQEQLFYSNPYDIKEPQRAGGASSQKPNQPPAGLYQRAIASINHNSS